MNTVKHTLNKFLFAAVVALAFTGLSNQAAASPTKEDLTRDAEVALQKLYKKNPVAEKIGSQAKAILIFPKIVKAGFVFGGAFGEGVLMSGSKADSYYNSVTGSFGWQIGVQSYGYVVFLMNEKAVEYLKKSHGWEIGVGPTVVAVNEGVAKNLSTTTLKDDAYAFIFDQTGLMASLSIEGTKISRIHPPKD
jgi:lipid-binding SYLF domain-containing protein